MKTKNQNLQRKMSLYAPLHKKKKLMHVALSKDLRIQLKRRSLGIRKGDEVRIIKGKFKNTQGTVTKVDLKKMKVYIDTAVVKKKSGGQVQVPISTAKLRITKLITTDKSRQKLMQIKV
ncbi:MAG: 50S ribosomal protein L24 [Candidatus Aenigmarchaeota archaeon]|nr:50S ribosomal protein L24 [Candidatus Aenigmarchaeota archaeon]